MIDAHAAGQQLAEPVARGPGHERQVVALGQHDRHVQAAQGRGLQGADQRRAGQEVRRHDQHPLAGAGHRGGQQRGQTLGVARRPVLDRAAGGTPVGGDTAPAHPALAPGGERPVGEEHGLDLAHDRAGQPELQVGGAAGLGDHVPVADVHAAGERHAGVGDQNLAVVAQVELQRRRDQARRQETRGLHAFAAQQGHRATAGPGVVFADAVDEHPHIHAAGRGPSQRRDETPAHGIGLEDVGGHVDEARRPFDGLEHGRIGGLAVVQHGDVVAGHDRPGREPVAGRGQAVATRVQKGAVVAQRRVGARLVRAETVPRGAIQPPRPDAHAVDAEHVVEQRPDRRKQQRDADPAEGAAGRLAGEQGVDRRRQGAADHDDDRGPELQGVDELGRDPGHEPPPPGGSSRGTAASRARV